MCKNTMGKCLFHRAGGPASSPCGSRAPTLDELGHADLETALVAFARVALYQGDTTEARAVGQDLLDLLEELGVDTSDPRTEE